MSYKDTNIANPGTATQYGADDMEQYARNFNGQVAGLPPVTIKNSNKWGFWDGIFYIRNQSDTFNVTLRGPINNPGNHFDLTLPPIVANDTLATIGLAQTWALKQRYNSGVVFPELATPGAPGVGLHNVYVAANGHLVKIDNNLVVKDYDITAATVPADMKDAVIAARDTIRCFKVSSTYYAVNKDSTVISSSSTPQTVLAAAFAIGGEIFIDGDWDLTAGFAGFTILAETHIIMSGDCVIKVPNGYTGFLFNVTEGYSTIEGGSFLGEQGSAAKNWTAIKLGTGTSADFVEDVIIEGLYVWQAGTGIEIAQGSTGEIRSNRLRDITIADGKKGVNFTTAVNNKINQILFENVNVYAGADTTDGFAAVAGQDNNFVSCYCIDFAGGDNEMTISSNSVRTSVYGGRCTGFDGLFTDAGTDTYIDDGVHTEFKLKGTALSPAQITSNQDNYNPTNWNEKVNTLRLTSDASRDITGLVPGANPKNRIVEIINVGSNAIVLKNDVTSTAANRFLIGTDITLGGNNSIILIYDSVSSRWRPLNNYTVATAGAALLAASNVFLFGQEIFENASDLLLLTRDVNTNNSVWGTDYWAKDSASNFHLYASIYAKIVDNTNGSEDGQVEIHNSINGTLTKIAQWNEVGNYDVLRGITYEGIISPAQLTADTNNWNPTDLQTSTTIRIDCDSSFRKLSGITAPVPDRAKILRLINISNNTLLLINQGAASTAANRFDFKGYDLPLFGRSEIELHYDKTLDRWVCADDIRTHIVPPGSNGYYYNSDMFTIAADGTIDWFTSGTGAANSVSAITSLAGHPGVVQMQTGTTSSGTTNFQLVNDSCLILGNLWYWSCTILVRFNNLSDGTNRYGVDIGFLDNVDAASPIDGVYAFYEDDVNSGNWVLRCESNNTITSNNSSSAVATGTWYRVKVVVYPDGTAELFIDDVSVATSNGTNVPTGAGRGTGFGTSIFKLLGTTSRAIDIDSIEVIAYGNVVR